MRNAKRMWGIALGGLVLAGAGVAAAQSVGRAASAPPAQRVADADALIARMEGTRGNIRHQLEGARAQRDVVKTLCLNDKLNQMDVAIRSARERRNSLEAASARRDTDLANHEATILGVMRQRSEEIAGEAAQCIGQDANYIGRSQISVSIDPNMPRTDPTTTPDSSGTIVVLPTCASCVK